MPGGKPWKQLPEQNVMGYVQVMAAEARNGTFQKHQSLNGLKAQKTQQKAAFRVEDKSLITGAFVFSGHLLVAEKITR